MITGKNAELYFGESVYKQMNIEVVGTGIVIDNSMREQDTFTLTETLCDSSELKFGSCLPNQISFVGREIPTSIKGKRLHPVEILEGNEDDPFEYGTYTVYSDVPTSDRTKRQITAYDAMYDIINADVKSWYAGLTFPMTLKAFRDSFFAHLGIAQKETTLVNDGMTVNKTLIATQTDSESTITEEPAISGKTIIEAICEINGVFGNINHDGEFEYVELKEIVSPLYPANDLYPSDDLLPRDPNTISMTGHYITFDYEDFQSRAITQLEIRTSDSNTGVMVGTSGNNYVICGNFLVSDKSGAELESIAENTLSVIKKVSYTPIKSSSCVGNPCLELGDPIRFNTSREIVESYVLQRTLTGIQSKHDSITSLGTETHSAKVNSIKDTISNVEKRTNKLERTSDHTLSEISNLDEMTSTKFEQTASQIQAEVTRAQGAETSLGSQITQTAESITAEVNKKVGTDEIRSKFAMSPENVTIESGSINFKSNTIGIDSDNFGLDPNTGETKFYGAQTFYDSKSMSDDYAGIFCYGYVEGMSSPLAFIFNTDIYVNESKVALDEDITAEVTRAQDAENSLGSRMVALEESIPDTSHFITGIEVTKSPQSGDSGYTKNYFLRVSSGGIYKEVGASQIHVSDRRLKRDITIAKDITNAYMRLTPVHFRYKENVDGVDGHWHYGFIAQDVKQAFIDAGIYSENEALVGRCVEDDTWLLDKDELHAMHVQMIQKQQKEIELLKQENLALKNRLSILEQKMEVLENVINSKNN